MDTIAVTNSHLIPVQIDATSAKSNAPFFINKGGSVGALLLHSFTSSPYEMRDLANFLADKNISSLAPTIAGHGSKPENLSKTTIADWLDSVDSAYRQLAENVEKIYLIGSSFGGNLSFYLAEKYQDNIGGVISLGTPVKLRWQKIFKLALYSYGNFKKYQKKRRSDYRNSFHEAEQIVYPVMPVTSIKNLFKFLKKSKSFLPKIKTPVLIIQSEHDRIVKPNSAQYLHQKIGSQDKRILWLNGGTHTLTNDEKKDFIFSKIYQFISEN